MKKNDTKNCVTTCNEQKCVTKCAPTTITIRTTSNPAGKKYTYKEK